MIKKFVSWYVRKVWKKEFILKSEIAPEILRAKEDESNRKDKIFEEIKRELEEKKDLEKTIEVAQIESELIQTNKRISAMKDSKRDVQDIYYKTVERAKKNAMVSLDMSRQSKRLAEMITQIDGLIQGIRHEAERHFEKVQKDEYKDKKILE